MVLIFLLGHRTSNKVPYCTRFISYRGRHIVSGGTHFAEKLANASVVGFLREICHVERALPGLVNGHLLVSYSLLILGKGRRYTFLGGCMRVSVPIGRAIGDIALTRSRNSTVATLSSSMLVNLISRISPHYIIGEWLVLSLQSQWGYNLRP